MYGTLLWSDDQSAALLFPVPRSFDIRQRHAVRFDPKLTCCDPFQQFTNRLHPDVRGSGGAAGSSAENFEPRTAECSGRKRDRWPRALAHLDQASSGRGRPHIMASDGSEQDFGGLPPDIIDDHVKSTLARFPNKS